MHENIFTLTISRRHWDKSDKPHEKQENNVVGHHVELNIIYYREKTNVLNKT